MSLGDLPVRAPKMSQREARTFRFSQHAAINVCERAPAPADVSSLVIAAPLDGFQTSGETGGQVEPGPVTKRPGCSGATGVDLVSFAEAELDRRERVLAQTSGTAVVGTVDKRTYSDILKHNISANRSIPHVHIPTNAQHTTGAAGLGVQAQVQRRPAATHPEVPSPTSTSSSPMSDQPSVINMYDTYVTCEHDFPKVGEMIKTWENVGNQDIGIHQT